MLGIIQRLLEAPFTAIQGKIKVIHIHLFTYIYFLSYIYSFTSVFYMYIYMICLSWKCIYKI